MRLWLFAILFISVSHGHAAALRVAVAANFAGPLRTLVEAYQHRYPERKVDVTVASTGKLAVQIRHGAPFDVFLAADRRRPEELAREGRMIPGTRRTYALGVLVLWSPVSEQPLTPEALKDGAIAPLALANARSAPYGAAAESVLAALQVPASVMRVRGESVGQSYHFAHSGAAAAAFVALAQVIGQGGSQWRVPPSLYAPIVQQAGLLRDTEQAWQFYHFLFSETARAVIEQAGYRVPDAD